MSDFALSSWIYFEPWGKEMVSSQAISAGEWITSIIQASGFGLPDIFPQRFGNNKVFFLKEYSRA